ncbi:MAG TPA: alpha-amylase family glycosyl hydrolase [Burkholderiales bacterium]|nr:alpha-amylase family glycosyl hydrolase [Burkholderiales bacterium]
MPSSAFDDEVRDALQRARAQDVRPVRVGRKTVRVASPFPSPEDWRDQWIYFLLVDRFNNPMAPPRFEPFDAQFGMFQGGTFEGVRRQLDYLQGLGAGAIWLSPVLKNCQYSPYTYHGYGIQDFLRVEPRFCRDPAAAQRDPKLAEQELRELIDQAHARGIFVILDVVLNHAGDVFEYVLPDGRGSPEADWSWFPYGIRWRDAGGRGRANWMLAPQDPAPDAAVWPSELRRNELFRRQGRGGEAGGDFASLKEFVTAFQEQDRERGLWLPVRSALIRAYQYLVATLDVDGFRIDTLKYVEPDFALVFGNAMREFALSIGKKNFFTFGEVYDEEDKIARFIGRQATQDTDLMGVDAALDFPLFFRLPAMAKGWLAPSEVVSMFERRKAVERDVLSSHGEASRFFVTFLDNHDQRSRFFYSPPEAPMRYADQLTLGAALLFTLQGIPCLYYGTEQGLSGQGDQDSAVREALWGKPNAFDRDHPFFRTMEALSAIRRAEAALRYGRQYFRPISGDGVHFGVSGFRGGVLAFSRILNEDELLVVANADTQDAWSGEVIVDLTLNADGALLDVLFSNKSFSATSHAASGQPSAIIFKAAGSVEIREVSGALTRGPVKAARVSLAPMEVQILRRVAQ